MPEWLLDSFQVDAELPLHVLIVRIALALVLGCVVAGVYRVTAGKTTAPSLNLMATLVLLTVLIAMVTLVIGNRGANSVALAFSLVGALSIVRFRTVVEDTRDTAFVIFAVAVGMAVGAGYLAVPLVGIPFSALAAFLFRARDVVQPVSLDALLTVRVGTGIEPEPLLRGPLDTHISQHTLKAITTARQGAALELTYSITLRLPSSAVALVRELHGVEGVQNVELRQT